MKFKYDLLFFLVLPLLIANKSFALFDIRLTGTLLASKPDLTSVNVGSNLSYTPSFGFGGDVLVSPPLFDLGFGVRVESLGTTLSKDSITVKTTNSRTALLVDYRFINTLLLIGIIGSYGISHSGGVKVSDSLTGIEYDWQAEKVSSYSLGVEAGVKLLGFILGLEVGTESMKWANLTDKNNVSGASTDLDMSGPYTKVFLGFGF